MVVINVLILVRLRSGPDVSEKEFFANLLLDVCFLTLLFYFTGGFTNPLVSYYLIPLIISAAVLRPAYTWLIAFLCIGSYTLLLFYYQPLPLFNMTGNHAMSNAHFLGMWINFGFSALLISWFVVRMASALRQQARAIAHNRELGLRDDGKDMGSIQHRRKRQRGLGHGQAALRKRIPKSQTRRLPLLLDISAEEVAKKFQEIQISN